MLFKTNVQRHLIELALFGFLVSFGISVNNQALIALGMLVLSHCLPSLVLASVRNLSQVPEQGIPTYYSNGFCSFREKEIVELISCALLIGASVALLALSLQRITFAPAIGVQQSILLALIYIAFDLAFFITDNIAVGAKPIGKPGKRRMIRILVALSVIVIAGLKYDIVRLVTDTVVGLGVLFYVTYTHSTRLLLIARKNIDYTPDGISIEDVKGFLENLPGVLNVRKIYFRRVNEIEHELGAHVTLQHFLLENSEILKEMIKREVEQEFGLYGMTIELLWLKTAVEKSDRNEVVKSNIIILEHSDS
ncbi:MAG: hypothetical protein AB8B64_18405 [Granulosicoccus sp.]